MKNIKEYNLNELKQELISLGEKGYRAEQIFNWIYVEKVKSFDDMISLGLFEIANENQGYNEVKITICIWLEGYDADYISGISTNEMKIFLNFIKRDHEEVAS